jgi:sterol desaturase/sphingolipid hydroxylase (fatty acid hydroxylase superfamily)
MIAASLHLLACMAVFSLVEWLWPSSAPHKWWRRPVFVDLLSWLILPLAVSAGIALGVIMSEALVAACPQHGFWNWALQMRIQTGGLLLPIQIAMAFVALDFLSYCIHRAYHRVPFLWSFHVMHHTSEELDWLSTLRLHPVSQIVDTAIVAGLLLLAGVSLKAVIAANALVGFSAVLAHANVKWTFGPFRHVFVSPVFHHWHHARHDGGITLPPTANFGAALSIWDRIFGTSLQDGDRPACFGVEGAPAQNLWSLVLHPLQFCLRTFRKR